MVLRQDLHTKIFLCLLVRRVALKQTCLMCWISAQFELASRHPLQSDGMTKNQNWSLDDDIKASLADIASEKEGANVLAHAII